MTDGLRDWVAQMITDIIMEAGGTVTKPSVYALTDSILPLMEAEQFVMRQLVKWTGAHDGD